MLRTERSGMTMSGTHRPRDGGGRQILLAVAPPPRTPSFALAGWPQWLVPLYHAGGHRPAVQLIDEER
jgi:hypothetical protein